MSEITTIREAVKENDLKILHKLLSAEPFEETYDEKTDTELITACRLGHHNAALLLINFGANINYQNDKGWTALMLANDKGHAFCVQVLLDNNANMDLVCLKGSTALMHSAYRGYYDCVTLLVEKGNYPQTFSPIHNIYLKL